MSILQTNLNCDQASKRLEQKFHMSAYLQCSLVYVINFNRHKIN